VIDAAGRLGRIFDGAEHRAFGAVAGMQRTKKQVLTTLFFAGGLVWAGDPFPTQSADPGSFGRPVTIANLLSLRL
jgi:hypothetical protein